jgi:hypothetical protein
MKHFYLLISFLGCFLFGKGQQVNFVSTVFYNSTNQTITIQVGLQRDGNCNSEIGLVSIDFELQWSSDVILQSSGFIPNGARLDDTYYFGSNPATDQDNGTPANPVAPWTVGSKSTSFGTYQTYHFQRSTNKCDNVIRINCGQIVPFFTATFTLTNPANFNLYRYSYDHATPANNSNFIAQFISNVGDQPTNQYKEILIYSSKTQSYTDVSGQCPAGADVNNGNTLTADVNDNNFVNTYGAILPAVINLFDVKKQGTQTILNWATSSEELNKGFEIQRKVNSQFETIGFMNSKAMHSFSSQLLNYSFVDDEQFSGKTVYYRLKLIAYSGQEVYSEVRVIRNAGKLQTLIYPNPSAGNLQIVLPQNAGTNTIELTDNSGKRIRVWEKYNAPVLNISNLPKGLFTFTITNLQTAERTVEKIIVQ